MMASFHGTNMLLDTNAAIVRYGRVYVTFSTVSGLLNGRDHSHCSAGFASEYRYKALCSFGFLSVAYVREETY